MLSIGIVGIGLATIGFGGAFFGVEFFLGRPTPSLTVFLGTVVSFNTNCGGGRGGFAFLMVMASLLGGIMSIRSSALISVSCRNRRNLSGTKK